MMSVWVVAGALAGAGLELPVVALDAGHGGAQDGAVGVCGVKEKDVTLAVSLELAQLLEASRRVRPLLTRATDTTVELHARAEMANAAKASLFVSVHANSGVNPSSHGIETFFLSRRASDKRARKLALRENEGRAIPAAAPVSAVERILRGMALNAAHVESQRLARRLEQELTTQLGARPRGVMQAPFLVLMGARMAAALVETGFLTNREECEKLGKPEYRSSIARALATSIIAHLDGEGTIAAR